MSFTEWNIMGDIEWVGLANYKEMFASGDFWIVLRNTGVFTLIYVPGALFAGFLLSLVINVKVKAVSFFRALFFSPLVTSAVAIGMAWSWILSPKFGILNYFINAALGIEGPAWLGNPDTALMAVALVFIWKEAGFYMIIFLAGLQNIPNSLYEVASVDGASWWHKLRKITLPLLTPTTFFALIIAVFRLWQHFQLVYAMTKGGPGISSTTLPYSIYQNAFVFYNMGYASALAYVFVLIVGAITALNFYYKSRWVTYQ
ncbi:sugar ABC transporter permease [Candidatus Bipolaricaulota bacterium]|nr:sugar ABC transporter permease [Candidatus Bipolaricaulota bacterium]